MAARTRYRVAVAISSNPDNEERDLGNTLSEVVNDSLGDGGTWQNVLPANATDVPVQLTQVTSARFIYVRAFPNDPNTNPVAITLKKNAIGGEAWTVAPLPNAKEAQFMTTTDGVTALYLSNPSPTVAMRVIIVMAGD
jgi:hypothetical protein